MHMVACLLQNPGVRGPDGDRGRGRLLRALPTIGRGRLRKEDLQVPPHRGLQVCFSFCAGKKGGECVFFYFLRVFYFRSYFQGD